MQVFESRSVQSGSIIDKTGHLGASSALFRRPKHLDTVLPDVCQNSEHVQICVYGTSVYHAVYMIHLPVLVRMSAHTCAHFYICMYLHAFM